ncbi:MAG: Gfo/Idh/MocA family oxidoreductase [Chloroflexaceae bacterium]|nr:Gfo/Idh/MocA family oxidoreductase [Chloroflexaceae bacterium]
MTNSANPIGIGICGCGYWGMNYVRVFSELPESAMVAVCDQNPERLNVVAQRFPAVARYTDIDEMLQRDDIAAVVVATEAGSHFKIASRALAAGRHVLSEKPLTTTVSDGQALIQLAEREGVTLMVGHTFIYNAGVRKVKELIDQEEMGQVYYMYARRTNLGPIRRDVNALWDLAPHDVSIFNYFLNSTPDWVSAVASNVLQNDREDVGFIAMHYPNNVLCHIHVSWADPNKVREVVVVSSNKRIVFDDVNPQEQVRIFERGVTVKPASADSYAEHTLLMRDGDIISPRIAISEPLKTQCKHFLECVTNGQRPITDGQAGVDIVRVMKAIEQSIHQHGAPVQLADF